MRRHANNSHRDEPFPARQPMVLPAAALCLGIVVDRFFPLPIYVWWLGAALLLTLWVASFRQAPRFAPPLLVASIVFCGAAWHHWSWQIFSRDDVGRAASLTTQPVCFEAIALSSPRRVTAPPRNPLRAIQQGDETRLPVRVVRVRSGDHWQSARGNAQLHVEGHLLGVRAGDRLQVFADFAKPEPAMNPGEFDFAAHHRADRRLVVFRSNYPDCVTVLDSGHIAWYWRWLDEIRRRAGKQFWEHLDPQNAPLASAVILGTREEIDREQTEAYFLSGTIHLISISGLHVGILASALYLLAHTGLIPRRIALVIVIVLTILYCLLTDALPPVIRATVLVTCTCVAWLWSRRVSMMNILAFAAIIVLLVNPAELFRTGPQLSFLAVATIACFTGYLREREPDDPLLRLIQRTRPWYQRLARRGWSAVWKMFVLSSVIWLISLPLVMYRFHMLSTVALLLNPIIALPILIALLTGFGVLALGWLIPPLGAILGWVCDWNFAFIQHSAAFSTTLAHSYFWVAGPPLWWVLGFYGALAWYVAFPRYRFAKRWNVAFASVWLALAAAVPIFSNNAPPNISAEPTLLCTFVSVGHGAAVILELPDGKTLLYDAGSLGSPERAADAISACLWQRQITHLDGVVLSHADVDHYNAVTEVLKRFSVGTMIVSPVMFEDATPALVQLGEQVEAAGVPIQIVAGGEALRLGEQVTARVLHPPPKGVIGSDNANSIVLLVEFAGRRILLTGDLESPGMDDVIAEVPIDVDVALAPHHGSVRSHPAGFAAWCTPEWVVISGGRGFDATAATRDFREAGAEVLHTGQSGAVLVSVTPAALHVQQWLDPQTEKQANPK